jgi:amidohydrolase
LTPDLKEFFNEHLPELIRFRRHLHAHPELSREEFETTALLVRWLESVGLQPRLIPGSTGLTCDVGHGDGPMVVLRADLDALALKDEKDVPYRSRKPGVCHACGHDVHTTVLLGVGLALAGQASKLPFGRVRLLFQPAEEVIPGGSLDVVDAGLVDDADVIYALHCDPNLDVGRIGVRTGPITAAYDRIAVRLPGPDGTTRRPHTAADLVFAICQVTGDLPVLLSRQVGSESALLMTFGSVQAGTAHATMPTSAEAKGTLRVLDKATWEQAPKRVEQLLKSLLVTHGMSYELDYQRGAPPVVNDEVATTIMANAARVALGPDAVAMAPQSMGGEDFAWYLDRVPGSLARLGVRMPGHSLDLHSGEFDVDEDAISVGIRVLVQVAVDALEHYKASTASGATLSAPRSL